MWCTIVNAVLLIISFLVCSCAGDWVYRMHGRFCPISREAFNVVIYSLIALYKILVVTFNFVPYVALSIVG
jgi:hypothetical protein